MYFIIIRFHGQAFILHNFRIFCDKALSLWLCFCPTGIRQGMLCCWFLQGLWQKAVSPWLADSVDPTSSFQLALWLALIYKSVLKLNFEEISPNYTVLKYLLTYFIKKKKASRNHKIIDCKLTAKTWFKSVKLSTFC